MKIDHIALYVNDLEGAKDFFETYFHAAANEGYHNEKTDFRSYFLTFSDGSRLEIMTKPDLTDSGNLLDRFGYAHIAFSVGSRLPHPVWPQSHRGWILRKLCAGL